MQATIEIVRRYPTAKLAQWEIQFLPSCDWKATERDGWHYLQFSCEATKARRILEHLRGELRTLPLREVST